MSRPDLVIFDCDGVLIDSEILSSRIDAAALTEAGYPISEAELLRRFTGMPARDAYAVIEAELGRALPDGHAESVQALILDAYREELKAIAGIDAALDALAGAAPAPRVCVASSSEPDKLRFGLECVGLYGRFAPDVFSASMVARGKPAPDLFLYAAERMGVPPSRCLVVEDSVAGVTAARRAGMAVMGFTGGGHADPGLAGRLAEAGAAPVFGRMADLPALIAARAG